MLEKNKLYAIIKHVAIRWWFSLWLQITHIYQERKKKMSKNLMEKSHIAIGLIDNLCHEIVYHKHNELDYDVMTNICIETIVKLLNY